MSDFNCRANVSGICAGFEAVSWHSSFYLKRSVFWNGIYYCQWGTIADLVLTGWLYSNTLLQIAAYCQPHQDLRFGLKFIFTSKTEIIDVDGLNWSYSSSATTVSHFLHCAASSYTWADSGHKCMVGYITVCQRINKKVSKWINK